MDSSDRRMSGSGKMSSIDVISRARPRLAAIVGVEKSRLGKRMMAYASVASMVGRSPGWVRKFIGRQPDLGLAHNVALNIAEAYARLCLKIEMSAAADVSTLEADIAAAEINYGKSDRMVRAANAAAAAALAILMEGDS